MPENNNKEPKEEPIKLSEWLNQTGFNRTDFKNLQPFLENGVEYIITPTNRYFIYTQAIKEKLLSTSWREKLS